PTLMMSAGHDRLAPASRVLDHYASAQGPKRLVSIDNAGHLAFTDVCTIARGQGGVLRLANDSGIRIPPIVLLLGNDGCREADLAAERAWPSIKHYTTAHLRSHLGLDSAPLELGADSTRCFAPVGIDYRYQ
ncbi:MAG: hypothetical protein H0U74_05135, partial [Bradymonadaceae bacterium]|nr:hypothetical protein [Lujinxingiaceae bacterium]